MKVYGGWMYVVYIHILLTLALDGGEWSASRPGRFTLRGKNAWYPLDRRLGMPQNQSGRYKLNSVVLVRKRTIPSDRRLAAKLVSTFAGRGCRVVGSTDPHGR
jgi:hypothetical protein